MSSPILKVKRLHPDVRIPERASEGAACFDIRAYMPHSLSVNLLPGECATISTGLAFEIPVGYALMIYSRSGHGFNHNVSLQNCVGVIDSDYRGEVQVAISKKWIFEHYSVFHVSHGDRIAQAMLIKLPEFSIEISDSLTETERGTGGLGSTGA